MPNLLNFTFESADKFKLTHELHQFINKNIIPSFLSVECFPVSYVHVWDNEFHPKPFCKIPCNHIVGFLENTM